MESALEQLIKQLAKLPGLGPRSARRAVIYLLKHKAAYADPLLMNLQNTLDSIQECAVCGNFDTTSPCHVCTDEKRDKNTICVVEDVMDLWAFERGNIFRGQYHILGGVLSAMDGVGPSDLRVDGLISRIRANEDIQEIIIATNATVDGQTTAFYLMERIAEVSKVKVTRLARGIPVGGELDYLDDGTLSASLKERQLV